jgi:Bacteriophage related domain of unknown function
MSLAAVRAALETRLAALSPAIDTAWQNDGYVPTVGTKYQRVDLMLANPDNPEMGSGYREQGFLQVTLKYGLDDGSTTAEARAQAIRDHFPRALALTSGGIVVTIDRTPAIGSGTRDGDRWSVPVRIFWHANVQM